QRGGERQCVDDSRQHAHVVAGDPVAALRGHGDAAEDVAAPDHDADFNVHGAHFGNVGGDAVDDRDIDAETLAAHQGFARGFEEDALEQGCWRHELIRI